MTGHAILKLIAGLKEHRDKYEPEAFWTLYRRLRSQFYRSPEWRRLRLKVRKKYRHCFFSERHTKHLDVHHVIFIFQDPSQGLNEDNLILACRACHKKIHNG